MISPPVTYLLKQLQICHLEHVTFSWFDSKTKINSGPTYIYCGYSCRSKWKNSWFLKIFTLMKQCFWYGHVYYFHQMRFTCSSTPWKKYVHWFNNISSYFTYSLVYVWNTLKTSLCFEFKGFMFLVIWSSGNICDIKIGIAKFLLVSVSPESFLLRYSASGVPSYSIWLRDC